MVSTQAFFFTLSKLSFGIASDKVSSVILFSVGLIICGLAIFGLAFAGNVSRLLIVLAVLGGLQGAGWVPATKLVAKWFDGSYFGKMFSILGCGNTVAGLLLPLFRPYHFRSLSLTVGPFAVLFGLVTLFILRDDHDKPAPAKSSSASKESSVPLIVTSPILWGIALSYIYTLEVRSVCENWLPIFIADNGMQTSTFMVSYELSGLMGTVVSGIALDFLCERLNEQDARRYLAVVCSSFMLLSVMFSTSVPAYTTFFGMAAGFFMNASLNIWCLILSVAGHLHVAGSCSAFVSFIANFGPILSGSPLAWLITHYGFVVFIPFFGAQMVLFLIVSSLRLPLSMRSHEKVE